MVIDRGKRSETQNEVKTVENINRNRQEFSKHKYLLKLSPYI